MSKKRPLILVLALLPLALGGAVVATLANGSRSEHTPTIPEVATLEAAVPDVEDEGLLAIAALSDPAGVPYQSANVAGGVDMLRSQEPSIRMHSDQPSDEPTLASQGVVESTGAVATVADVGQQSQAGFNSSWNRRSLLRDVALANRTIGGGRSGAAPSTGSDSEGSMTSPSNTTLPSKSSGGESALPPSEDPKRGSSGENSGAGPGQELTQPSTEQEQTRPVQEEQPNKEGPKQEGQGPKQEGPKDQEPKHEQPPAEQDPIETSHPVDSDPIYIPPQETNPPAVQVPEPATLGLLGLGLLGCAVARRRKTSTV